MRRQEREVLDSGRIDRVILACDTIRLGFSDPEGAYVVPMNFGFAREGGERVFYLHCAGAGRKMDYLLRGGPVGFEMDKTHEIRGGADASEWTALYESVIGTGEARLIEDPLEKAKALDLIMAHYSGRGGWDYTDAQLKRTAVIKLKATTLSCKSNLPINPDTPE